MNKIYALILTKQHQYEKRFKMKHNIKHITGTWKHKSKAKFMDKIDGIILTKQHPYQTRFKMKHNIKHITGILKR